MKRLFITAFLTLVLPLQVFARDTIVNIPLQDVLDMPEAAEQLDPSVKFILAGNPVPKNATLLEFDVSNKKTNAVGKTDEFACRWAALGILKSFQEGARRRGANAVVNIVSYYKKNETKSATTLECHAGSIVAGLAIKGQYAKLP